MPSLAIFGADSVHAGRTDGGRIMRGRLKRKTAWHDPIVAEVRAAREALFAAAGYDIREFCRRARAAQANSGHAVVTRRSRRTSRPEVSTMKMPRRRRKTG